MTMGEFATFVNNEFEYLMEHRNDEDYSRILKTQIVDTIYKTIKMTEEHDK